MSKDLLLNQLGHQAVGIAAVADQNAQAAADKKAASAELLDAVVETIRPALRAMASRIVIAHVTTMAGKTEKTLDEPGVYLSTMGLPQDRPGPHITAGRWQGTDLFLCREGSFVMLSYDGPTDHKGTSTWQAEVVELATRDVVDMFNLAVVMDAIARAMAEQANGNAVRRTEQMKAQAARLRALVTLVRSI